MTLSQIFLLVGGLHAGLGLWMCLAPGNAGPVLKAFPRRVAPGVVLMLAGTAWFVWNLLRSDVTDFKDWQPMLVGAFSLLGVGCCIFVQDYLSIRGGAVVALLACDYFLDVRRPSDNPWSLLLSVWCYLVIVCSVWWVGSPWRVRDLTAWLAEVPGRMKRSGWGVAGFGVAMILLGLAVIR